MVVIVHRKIPWVDEPILKVGSLVTSRTQKESSPMHQLAEGEVDQQGRDEEEMKDEKPRNIKRKISEMDQPMDEGFHIDEIGSEEKLHQEAAESNREKENQGDIISQNGDKERPVDHQPSGKQED